MWQTLQMEMWFWKSLYALFFCLASSYLLVIGPSRATRNRRGNKFLYHGRQILIYIVLAFPSFVYILAATTFLSRKNCYRIRAKLNNAAFKLLGINWEIRRGEEGNGNKFEEEMDEGGAVFVINHQTWIDILALWVPDPPIFPLSIVMKIENIVLVPYSLQNFLDGGALINRSKGPSAYEKLESTVLQMSRIKGKVAVFAEGTRNWDSIRWSVEGGRKIKEFKSGAFRAAIKAGVPIVPVVISPYYFVDEERLIHGQGKVIINILQKIPTIGMTTENTKDLMQHAHRVMSAAYDKLKEEVIENLPRDHYLRTK